LDPLIKEFLEVIAQEVKSLENFLALLTDQENLLLNNKLSSLSQSWEKQKKALSWAKNLERKRLVVTQKLSNKFKIDESEFNLSLLSELVEESCSTRLEELQRILLDLYQKVELQRKKNQKLIRESSGFLSQKKGMDSNDSIPLHFRIRDDFIGGHPPFGSLSKKVTAH
jgi:uncharacterized circularly permuted ATP-grasp superfamily protein